MKKIVLLLAAFAATASLSAQVVVGLQGGFYQHKTANPAYLVEFGDDHHHNLVPASVEYTTAQTSIVGGLQVGYQITPKLYAGVAGGIVNYGAESSLTRDYMFITAQHSSAYQGNWKEVREHLFKTQRSGWTVSPQVKYELARYGNMHFNVMLQGDIRSMGYSTVTESFVKPFENNNELIEVDPYEDGISSFSWGVSLRPTLVYEFSTHLSAELSLDFLSVGYISEVTNYDQDQLIYAADDLEHQNTPTVVLAHQETASTLYAGLNTFMETLRWENPMLRLGFNWKF